MRVFMVKDFAKWAKKESIAVGSLKAAVREAEAGLVDAYLGHGLIKKRVARTGAGKRGGFRTLLSFKLDEVSIFMYGFAKKQRDNISDKELIIYRRLANFYAELDQAQLQKMVETGHFIEVSYGE